MALFGLIFIVALIGAVALRGGDTTNQQQRPEFAGVPADVLENAGVHLSVPVQSQGLISESGARGALEAEYQGAASRIKEMALANLQDDDYRGPAWVFNMDTTGKTEHASAGVTGKVEWHLIFMNAKTGEYLSEIQLNNYAPDGVTPGPLRVEPVDPNQPDDGPAETPPPGS